MGYSRQELKDQKRAKKEGQAGAQDSGNHPPDITTRRRDNRVERDLFPGQEMDGFWYKEYKGK